MTDENKKPDFINRQKGIAVWKGEYQGKKTLNIKIELLGQWVTVYENEDKKILDKAKDIVNQNEPAAVVTEEKVE